MTEEITPEQKEIKEKLDLDNKLAVAELAALRPGKLAEYSRPMSELLFRKVSFDLTEFEEMVRYFVELSILKKYEKSDLYRNDGVSLEQLHSCIEKRESLLVKTSDDPVIKTSKQLGERDRERLDAINKHLSGLEETAKNKKKEFDKHSLKCSREMLLEWLKSKPGSLFNIKQNTFNQLWRKVTEYQCCSPAQVDKNFFKNIQG